RAFFGNSSNERHPVISSSQPGSSSKIGLQRSNSCKFAGYSVISTPSISYAVQILTVLRPVITSIELIDKSVIPLTRTDCRNTTESNQPTRRGRPVVVPYSRPTSRIWSPSSSNNSVGNGPSPTREVYALHTPITFDTNVGPTPPPTVTLPATGLLEVTNGYVP